MSVEYVTDNILNWPAGIRVICHGLSLQRAYGAGLARQIAEEYPAAKDAYMKAFEEADAGTGPKVELGTMTVAEVDGGKRIINAITQAEIGTHKVQLDYDALRSCLTQIRTILEGAHAEGRTWVLGLPKWIGCGLAGGDPSRVQAMVHEIFDASPVKCVVVERPVPAEASKRV